VTARDGPVGATPDRSSPPPLEPDLGGDGEPTNAVATPRQRLRTALIGLIEIVLSAGLLWLVLSRVDTGDMTARLGQLSFASGVFVAVLMFLHALLSAVRWRAIMEHLGIHPPLAPTMMGVLLERFVNQAIPSPVAGDSARFLEMRRTGLRPRIVAYSVVIDRLFALGGIFGVVTIMLPLAPLVIKSEVILKSVIVIGLAPLFGLAALLLIRQRWWMALHTIPLLRYPIGLAATLRVMVRTPRMLMMSAGLSLVIQALPIPCFLILARDLGIPLAVSDAAVLVPVIALAAVLPISIAGWGVRESAAVVLLAEVGMRSSDAALLSVLFGITTLLTGCLGGLLWLVVRHTRRTAQD